MWFLVMVIIMDNGKQCWHGMDAVGDKTDNSCTSSLRV
jgi:hypothetical protein